MLLYILFINLQVHLGFQVYISQKIHDNINKSAISTYISGLLNALFTEDDFKNKTLSGRRKDGTNKNQLDPNKVNAISGE